MKKTVLNKASLTGKSGFKKSALSLIVSGLMAGTTLTSFQVNAAYSLFDIYQMAVAHDATLAQAQATYQASQQSVKIARASLLPQVSANASYSDSYLNENAVGPISTTSGDITLKQSLYKHDSWAKYSQAKYTLKKAEYTIKSAQQDIIVRVADAYFKVLLAQEDVKLAKAKEKANKTQWDRAKASAEVGLASKTDVLQAKSSYDLSKSDRISAENNLDVAYEELTKLTGKTVKELKVIALNVKLPQPKLNIATYEQEAQDSNLTVLQAEEQANVANEEVQVQKSGNWFNVSLQAQYAHTKSSPSNPYSYSSKYPDNLSASIVASLPLYSGGGTTALVAQARSNYEAAEIGVRDAKESAKLNARVQVRNVERGVELVAANRAAVQSNDAFLEAAEEGYKVGLKDLLEVLTARTNKFQARRNLAQSLQNVVLSRLKLDAAVGTLNADNLQKYDSILSDPVDDANAPVVPDEYKKQ
ncbi:TolC family outer membrane protein [Hydrogenovibrio kuenenii]|uniref:TolC family outer membrane protein n=1 Tax=Hydrogenovibrio kuenenii TaxID=63658 RepID=UPI000463AF77|nr:TolC family outer membrane protein [Hydrogenovibrio kuenenii]